MGLAVVRVEVRICLYHLSKTKNTRAKVKGILNMQIWKYTDPFARFLFSVERAGNDKESAGDIFSAN